MSTLVSATTMDEWVRWLFRCYDFVPEIDVMECPPAERVSRWTLFPDDTRNSWVLMAPSPECMAEFTAYCRVLKFAPPCRTPDGGLLIDSIAWYPAMQFLVTFWRPFLKKMAERQPV